tara:strand:- start:5886 stop:6608 length:723 start_codon:yes stop_codon:yes gene_type:complete
MPKVVIPARLSSKRLPNKPLILIDGKPMIVRTAENAISLLGSNDVIVATDSKDIMDCCKDYGIKSIITSQNCLTGTDRVLEASKKLGFNEVYNLQGDEPLFPKEIIKEFINQTLGSNYPVDMGITQIENPEELSSSKIPKIVFNNNKELLYTSRARIPGSKNMDSNIGYKQVCIYKYNIEKLVDLSKQKKKTFFESIEDLELLRMLEIGITVKCRFLNYKEHFSVDTKEDLEKIIGFLKK